MTKDHEAENLQATPSRVAWPTIADADAHVNIYCWVHPGAIEGAAWRAYPLPKNPPLSAYERAACMAAINAESFDHPFFTAGLRELILSRRDRRNVANPLIEFEAWSVLLVEATANRHVGPKSPIIGALTLALLCQPPRYAPLIDRVERARLKFSQSTQENPALPDDIREIAKHLGRGSYNPDQGDDKRRILDALYLHIDGHCHPAHQSADNPAVGNPVAAQEEDPSPEPHIPPPKVVDGYFKMFTMEQQGGEGADWEIEDCFTRSRPLRTLIAHSDVAEFVAAMVASPHTPFHVGPIIGRNRSDLIKREAMQELPDAEEVQECVGRLSKTLPRVAWGSLSPNQKALDQASLRELQNEIERLMLEMEDKSEAAHSTGADAAWNDAEAILADLQRIRQVARMMGARTTLSPSRLFESANELMGERERDGRNARKKIERFVGKLQKRGLGDLAVALKSYKCFKIAESDHMVFCPPRDNTPPG